MTFSFYLIVLLIVKLLIEASTITLICLVWAAFRHLAPWSTILWRTRWSNATKNQLTVLTRGIIAYNFTLVAFNPNNNQLQFDFLAWLQVHIRCPSSNTSTCSSLPQTQYSLTEETSSCENEISTVNCLVYRSSPSVPRTRRIWLFRRRQKKRGKQQSTKSEKFIRNILVSLWPHIEGALSITIYNNEKILIFCWNHALIYLLVCQGKVISYRRSLCEAARKLDCYREMELKDDWEPTENKRESL